jgi:hypothetical protein
MTLDCKQKYAYEKLNKMDCKGALEIIDVNKLSVPAEYSQKLFECYLDQSRFKEAVNFSYSKAQKGSGQERLIWLSNYEKALLIKEDYKVSLAVASDAIKLAGALNINVYDWLWLDKFKAAYKLGDIKSMLDSVAVIEKIYANLPQSIEPYRKMIDYGIKQNDDLIIKNYAKKLIDVQNKIGVKTETPWVEFTYAEALFKDGDAKGALAAISPLAKAKLTSEQNARRFYMSAIYQLKLGYKKEALNNLKTCAGFKDGGAWTSLCVNGVELAK